MLNKTVLQQLFADRDAIIKEMVDARLRGDETAYRSLRAKKGNYTAKLNRALIANVEQITKNAIEGLKYRG